MSRLQRNHNLEQEVTVGQMWIYLISRKPIQLFYLHPFYCGVDVIDAEFSMKKGGFAVQIEPLMKRLIIQWERGGELMIV